MTTYPNFDSTGLNSNSNEVDLDFSVLHGLNFIFDQQRQTTNNNRNNGSVTANPLVSSANLTSQPSHNYYTNMLPTPEGSDAIMMSPYNMLPGSGNLNTYKEDDVSLLLLFFLFFSFYFTVLFHFIILPRITSLYSSKYFFIVHFGLLPNISSNFAYNTSRCIYEYHFFD
jgi:hypothetical protein